MYVAPTWAAQYPIANVQVSGQAIATKEIIVKETTAISSTSNSTTNRKSLIAYTDKYQTVISLFGNIGTLIAAIVAMLTLFEIAKQRRTVYRPEVKFVSTLFKATWPEFDSSSLKINAFNIGMGSATSIKITWDYDINRLIEMIKAINTKDQITVNYRSNDKSRFLSISINTDDYPTSRILTDLSDELIQTFDLILPASISENPVKVILPRGFCELILIYYYLHIKNRELSTIIDGIPIHALIWYMDIGNNEYERSVKMMLKPLSLTLDKNFELTGTIDVRS